VAGDRGQLLCLQTGLTMGVLYMSADRVDHGHGSGSRHSLWQIQGPAEAWVQTLMRWAVGDWECWPGGAAPTPPGCCMWFTKQLCQCLYDIRMLQL
jgi:hypothetical protein